MTSEVCFWAAEEPQKGNAMDYQSLTPHSLANMFDMIEGKDLDDLKASVKASGIKVRIVLYQGTILDGRNRYAAAKAVGYEFSESDFQEFEGSYKEAEDFVIAANINRRHLTNVQKQKAITLMLQKYPGLSNRRDDLGRTDRPSITRGCVDPRYAGCDPRSIPQPNRARPNGVARNWHRAPAAKSCDSGEANRTSSARCFVRPAYGRTGRKR